MVCETLDSYSLFCGELLLSLSWLYGHRTEHSGIKARVCGLKLSLGSVIWWASLSTVAVEKNTRHSIETNVQGWIGQSCIFCWSARFCVCEWMHLGPRVLDCWGYVRNRCCKVQETSDLNWLQLELTLWESQRSYRLVAKKLHEQHDQWLLIHNSMIKLFKWCEKHTYTQKSPLTPRGEGRYVGVKDSPAA